METVIHKKLKLRRVLPPKLYKKLLDQAKEEELLADRDSWDLYAVETFHSYYVLEKDATVEELEAAERLAKKVIERRNQFISNLQKKN